MTNRRIFASNGEFTICTIADEDRNDYVELHRQLNGETSLYLNPLSKDMMWEQILSNADSVFSIFNASGDYCGSIELQHSDSNTPEIGIDLLENKRNQGIASKVVRLFARRVYEIRTVDYFVIRISSNNLHSQHVFEKMGAVRIGEEKTAFSQFVERFKESAGKEGLDLEKYRHLFQEENDEVIYCYQLTLNPHSKLYVC